MQSLTLLCLSIVLGLATVSFPGIALGSSGEILVDRIVAVVDDDPIFLSDLQRIVGLGLVEPGSGETHDQLMRRVLDGLIDEKIRLHEIQRFDFGPLPRDELDAQIEALQRSFPDDAAYHAKLQELGLGDDGVRQILTRQMRVLIYIEQRLRPRVFVDLEEIQAYHESELAEAMKRQGDPLPPLSEVQEEISQLLHEVALNREIAAWTDRLRLESAVVDLWNQPATPLPPVLKTVGTPSDP